MPKTTVLVQLLAGPGVPVSPGYIRFTVPFRRVDGTAVLTTAPAPEPLDDDGRASVALDPGVWIVDEILPGYLVTRAVLVPESSTPVSYATLVEVDNPDRVNGFGPTWASRAEMAAAEAERQALAAEVARAAAATIEAGVDARLAGVVRSVNNVEPGPDGNVELGAGAAGLSEWGEQFGSQPGPEEARGVLGVASEEELATGRLGTRSGSKPIGEGEDYISIGDFCQPGWNAVTETGVDNGAGEVSEGGNPMQRAFNAAAAAGLPIFIGPGDWYSSKGVYLEDTAIAFHPASTGRLVHPRGFSAFRVVHKIRNPRVVQDARHVWIKGVDTGNPEQLYAQVTMAPTNMALEKPQRGDAFVLNSDAKIPGAFISETDRFVFQQEWVKVLGVGLDVSDVSATVKLSQGDQVRGEISGATGWVMSVAQTRPQGGAAGGQKTILLNGIVNGSGSTYFQPGENLTVGGQVRGAIIDRGAYIVTDRPLTYLYPSTDNPRIHRGIVGKPIELTGLRITCSGDPNQFLENEEERTPAISIDLATDIRGFYQVDSSWKSGADFNACFDSRVEYSVDGLPDLAEDTQKGWGYGAALVGACCRFAAHSRYSRGGRHGFTTVPRTTQGPAGEMKYWATQGGAIDVEFSGNVSGTTDAPVDFHGSTQRALVHKFHLSGSGAYNRTQSRQAGIQVRGRGVIVRDGVIEDVVDGVRDPSWIWPAVGGKLSKNTYTNVEMRGIRRLGFDFLSQTTNVAFAPGGLHKHKIRRCSVELDGSYDNPNERWGVDMDLGMLDVDDLVVTGHNGGYIRLGAVTRFVHRKGYSDHSESVAAGYNVVCTSTTPIPRLVLKGLEVEPTAPPTGTPTFGTAAIRTPAVQTIYTANVDAALDSTLPFAIATGGSNKITVKGAKETGRTLNGQSPADFTPGTIAAGASVLSTPYALLGADASDWVDARWLGAKLPAGVLEVGRVNADGTVQLELVNATPAPVTISTTAAVRYRLRK